MHLLDAETGEYNLPFLPLYFNLMQEESFDLVVLNELWSKKCLRELIIYIDPTDSLAFSCSSWLRFKAYRQSTFRTLMKIVLRAVIQ